MTDPDAITISVERRGEIAVLAVGGVIDFLTGPALKKALEDLIGDGLATLIIDLSEVTFMSSVGLAALASTRARLGDSAGFAVVAHRPPTVRTIQLTGLDRLFALCSTLDEALTRVGTSRLIYQPPCEKSEWQ